MSKTQTDPSAQKVDRRKALILAAYETIAERGYEGLRVRDVAFQVGINGATLHHYFPTKEVLIQAVLVHANARLSSIFDELNGTAVEQMRQYLQRLRAIMRTEPELFIVIAETNLRAQHGLTLNYVMQEEAMLQGKLLAILKLGTEQGFWMWLDDPVAAATTITTLLEGAGMWLVTRPDKVEAAISHIETWLHIN